MRKSSCRSLVFCFWLRLESRVLSIDRSGVVRVIPYSLFSISQQPPPLKELRVAIVLYLWNARTGGGHGFTVLRFSLLMRTRCHRSALTTAHHRVMTAVLRMGTTGCCRSERSNFGELVGVGACSRCEWVDDDRRRYCGRGDADHC